MKRRTHGCIQFTGPVWFASAQTFCWCRNGAQHFIWQQRNETKETTIERRLAHWRRLEQCSLSLSPSIAPNNGVAFRTKAQVDSHYCCIYTVRLYTGQSRRERIRLLLQCNRFVYTRGVNWWFNDKNENKTSVAGVPEPFSLWVDMITI